MTDSGIYIVMATFNGECFIREQIHSIQAQSERDWTLLVSDDGSGDSTETIVTELARQDGRIVLLPRRCGPPGHAANFEYLLKRASEVKARNIFLADQDDTWEPTKLQTMIAAVRSSRGQTLGVFSDLELVTADGKPQGSYLDRAGLAGMYHLEGLLSQNSVVGCSLMIRGELLDLALPFPGGLENHDWWLAMCAASLGQLVYVPERLVNYRQHGGNTIGANSPLMRLSKWGSIVRRQRRVWESKIVAVDELIDRLRRTDRPVPEALLAWRLQMVSGGDWRAPCRLLRSDFRPVSRSLLLVQLLALTPLANGAED